MTFVDKYVFPIPFILVWPVWLQRAIREGGAEWFIALGWAIGCAFFFSWSWHLARISISDDHFLISNYFSVHRVPFSHLRRLTEHPWDRSRTISLFFEPPTPLGAHVRVLPPSEFFSSARYDDIVAFLTALIQHREPNVA